MKYSILIFLIGLTSASLYGQAPENIASDRPGNAYTSTTVGKGVIQGQDGLEFLRAKNEFEIPQLDGSLLNSRFISESFAFTNYYRFGLSEKSELNAIIDYRYSESRIDNEQPSITNYASGISKIGLGFRQNILTEKGNAPALGVLLNANFNGLLNEYRSSNPDGFLLILAQKQLSNIFSFTANLGFNYGDFLNEGDFIDAYLYTLNLGYSITPKLSGYVEGYGQITNGEIADFYDTGLGYLINRNLQLDLYGGIYSEGDYIEYFLSAGLSFRFGVKSAEL